MRTIALSLCLCTLLLPACELPSGTRPEEADMFALSGLEAIDMEVLWPVLIQELEKTETGYIIDRDKTSRVTGEFETRWKMELAPYRYEGRRRKILGVAREMPEGSKQFTVRLTIWQQRNADIEDPMDPSRAIWQDVDPDKATVDLLFYRIKQHFPDFRRSSGPAEPR
ncbi:MAG: hypothetical protein ABFS86_16370 [Planctomycetota bacterium]